MGLPAPGEEDPGSPEQGSDTDASVGTVRGLWGNLGPGCWPGAHRLLHLANHNSESLSVCPGTSAGGAQLALGVGGERPWQETSSYWAMPGLALFLVQHLNLPNSEMGL